MIYNDRVTLFEYTETKDALGSIKRERVPKVYPCGRSKLSHKQQMGLFNTYKLGAFKLHLQGNHYGIEEVEYNGQPRVPQAVIQHPNATVIIID